LRAPDEWASYSTGISCSLFRDIAGQRSYFHGIPIVKNRRPACRCGSTLACTENSIRRKECCNLHRPPGYCSKLPLVVSRMTRLPKARTAPSVRRSMEPRLSRQLSSQLCIRAVIAAGSQYSPDTSITIAAKRLLIFSGIRSRSICSISAADFGTGKPFGGLGIGRLRPSPNQKTQ
jgi:hypothetical protein